MDRQLPLLRDPASVFVTRDLSLRDAVLRKADELITEWPEWGQIFDCVTNGVVAPVARPSGGKSWIEGILPRPAPDAVRLPQTIGDFVGRFTATCSELCQYACERAVTGTLNWLEDRSAEAADDWWNAQSVLTPEVRARLQGTSLQSLPQIAELILQPASIAESLKNEFAGGRLGDLAGGLDADAAFPLRRQRPTSWAEGSTEAEGTRHFMHVLRMRSAFIASAARIALDSVDRFQTRVYQDLLLLYRDQVSLPQGRDTTRFVTAVLGGRPDDTTEAIDPAALLAALRRPGAGRSGRRSRPSATAWQR